MITNKSFSTETSERYSRALFEVVKNGALKIQVNQQYSLADTQRAHEDLESRLTTGSTVLIP